MIISSRIRLHQEARGGGKPQSRPCRHLGRMLPTLADKVVRRLEDFSSYPLHPDADCIHCAKVSVRQKSVFKDCYL